MEIDPKVLVERGELLDRTVREVARLRAERDAALARAVAAEAALERLRYAVHVHLLAGCECERIGTPIYRYVCAEVHAALSAALAPASGPGSLEGA